MRLWTRAGGAAILTDVSIGGTLAEARHCAGLTVADVSARTRIREGLIRDIEHDEFGACGGDFYARGHIRAIAAVVGTDPYRLIAEYDAAHPSGRPVTLEELPGRSPRAPRGEGRHQWLAPVAFVLCLVVIGFVAIRLTPGAGGSPAAVPSSSRAATRIPAAFGGPHPSAQPAPASSPASSRSVPAAAPVTEVTPVSATAFGPGGTSHGDNPQGARLALSGNPATPWHTDWYTTARFGNLQTGTGLLLGLARTVTATGVTIRLGSSPGADLQLRAGTSLSDMPVVASAADAGGTVRLRLASHPHVRYLLIWFTLLPLDPAGTYQADISSVSVSASQPLLPPARPGLPENDTAPRRGLATASRPGPGVPVMPGRGTRHLSIFSPGSRPAGPARRSAARHVPATGRQLAQEPASFPR